MIVRQFTPCSLGRNMIFLGKQGENKATRIDIDVTQWRSLYPDAIISLYIEPPEGDGYMAAIDDDGRTVVWTVLNTDTAYAGNGRAELILTDADGTVIKSVTASTFCATSISAKAPVEPPEAIRPWVEKILEAIENSGVEISYEQIETAVKKYLSENPAVMTDDTLCFDESGRLSVVRADRVEQDNTKPVTSGAVYTEVGNINALLATI